MPESVLGLSPAPLPILCLLSSRMQGIQQHQENLQEHGCSCQTDAGVKKRNIDENKVPQVLEN